ncbi:required for meiotic nuclear division protein 1 homolog [Macrosteles quadrilineatus]|uniref:required for meiotic nuclear division protein 1 homolog n=1 Tax=Macrosteles quadrilineatus TaxID=74068 RepID=UPI0023E2B1E5|nr:required for meiotic nuclear division protein 1 homolog [Macrosteles quadrilineatus]
MMALVSRNISFSNARFGKFFLFNWCSLPQCHRQYIFLGFSTFNNLNRPLTGNGNKLPERKLLSSLTVGFRQFSENVKTQAKRVQRRKIAPEDSTSDKRGIGACQVSAYATCEEYNLEKIKEKLVEQNVYKPIESMEDPLSKGGADVIHAVANYPVTPEPRHIFFFREGSVVFWNTPELECLSVLDFLKRYQIGSYKKDLILNERELMTYSYTTTAKKSQIIANNFCLSKAQGRSNMEIDLEKFTLSNAMSLSVKLALWEASLNQYIDSVEYVVEDLKCGKKLRISRKEVTCKTGELFALRHSINLSSDLLDVPDFYWENDDLETLYLQLCNYFNIPRRTRVMNEKLNHCMELVELLTSHLSDRHHVRLEWMIIVLIMIEVVIEIIHASK